MGQPRGGDGQSYVECVHSARVPGGVGRGSFVDGGGSARAGRADDFGVPANGVPGVECRDLRVVDVARVCPEPCCRGWLTGSGGGGDRGSAGRARRGCRLVPPGSPGDQRRSSRGVLNIRRHQPLSQSEGPEVGFGGIPASQVPGGGMRKTAPCLCGAHHYRNRADFLLFRRARKIDRRATQGRRGDSRSPGSCRRFVVDCPVRGQRPATCSRVGSWAAVQCRAGDLPSRTVRHRTASAGQSGQ